MNIRHIIKEELIKEVGSIDRPYKWEGPMESGWMDDVGYFFDTDSGVKYIVKFHRYPNEEWERGFTADGKYGETGDKDVYRVMSTITQITLDFIDSYEPNMIEIPHIDTQKEIKTTIDQIRAKSAKDVIKLKMEIPNKRAKLNRIYLERNLPQGYKYELKGSKSIIKKNV